MNSFPQTSEALRETLQFLVSSDIESKHKRILMDVLVQALRDVESERRVVASPPDWQPDEERAVNDYLQGKIAKSWQHADELVMRLVSQLHRSPADVREKAIAMGAGAAVDFRLAKVRAP